MEVQVLSPVLKDLKGLATMVAGPFSFTDEISGANPGRDWVRVDFVSGPTSPKPKRSLSDSTPTAMVN